MATPETVHRQPIHPARETFGPMTAGSETRAERAVSRAERQMREPVAVLLHPVCKN